MNLVDVAKNLPPLLKLLELRVSSKGDGSRARGIPIDADALELWGQIRDGLRDLSEQIRSPYDEDDLAGTFAAWYRTFLAFFVQGRIPESKLVEATTITGAWVERIRFKYDHPHLREWQNPCPACGAQKVRVERDGDTVHVYAVRLDVTNRSAACTQCGETFNGESGLSVLRLLTNVADELAHGVRPDDAAYAEYQRYHQNRGGLHVA